MTIAERLIEALRTAAAFNRNDLSPPRVVLWPDGDQLWEAIVPDLAKVMPELFVLDASAINGNRGPGTWLRYLIAQNQGTTPIIYLPGVSRQAFRGAAGFPEDARHLYALQFQGQFWTQINGKDWTLNAFLTSEDGGLGLDMAKDKATLKALSDQLQQVMAVPVDQLQGRRLHAADLNQLAASDHVRMLLFWISTDGQIRQSWSANQWQAFRGLCKTELRFDPEKEGVITAAEKLTEPGNGWDKIWQRYAESHGSFPGIPQVLERVAPRDLFQGENERSPSYNRSKEEELREALLALGGMPSATAKKKLEELVREHSPRTSWVWARQGQSPLANAAAHFTNMIVAMDKGIDKSSWQAAAADHVDHGWQVDAEARRAYSTVCNAPNANQLLPAITAALQAVYLPWLEELATALQRWSSAYPKRSVGDAQAFTPSPGTILVFVDGLRSDICIELMKMMTETGLNAELEHAWSALPTVTATAKPAWSPMTTKATGGAIGDGFEPSAGNGKPMKAPDFRAALKQLGWHCLTQHESGDPATSAWTEAGAFDTIGHEQQDKLAWRIDEELRSVCHRIRELFSAGWSNVHVVTDHGWLWMPGDLPKVDLTRHLTLSRWGRCALPQPGASHQLPQVGWFWGNEHPVVLAPGISVFLNGTEYTHGGLTLQECFTPILKLSQGTQGQSSGPIAIEKIRWVNLRLNVQITGNREGLTVDLRQRPAEASSTLVAQAKAPDENGGVSLLVARDELIGQAAVVVVLQGETILAKELTTIGEN